MALSLPSSKLYLSRTPTIACLFFPPCNSLAKLLLWAMIPHLNEHLAGNEMWFVLL